MFSDISHPDHLLGGRAQTTTVLHFVNRAVSQHPFHPLVDTLVKLIPVAKNEHAVSRLVAAAAGRSEGDHSRPANATLMSVAPFVASASSRCFQDLVVGRLRSLF